MAQNNGADAQIERMRHGAHLIQQAGSRFYAGRGKWEDAHGEPAEGPKSDENGFILGDDYPDKRDADLARWEERGLLAGLSWTKTWRPTRSD